MPFVISRRIEIKKVYRSKITRIPFDEWKKNLVKEFEQETGWKLSGAPQAEIAYREWLEIQLTQMGFVRDIPDVPKH